MSALVFYDQQAFVGIFCFEPKEVHVYFKNAKNPHSSFVKAFVGIFCFEPKEVNVYFNKREKFTFIVCKKKMVYKSKLHLIIGKKM